MITGCRPRAAWRQDCGDGWGSRRMRWNQRRWLARYLVAMPRNARRKPLICWWRLLTVWIGSSPRTRSPADWIRASWLMPRAAAAGGKQLAPSVTSRMSGPTAGSSTAWMALAETVGSTAVSVVPVRSAATRTGTCSRDSPRLAALPPRLRGGRSSWRSPLRLVQQVGLVGLDDAAQGGGGGLDRLEEAVAPAERRGQRDVTLRGGTSDRVADAERPGELEPALLEPQPGQRRAGQGIEALAAGLAAVPAQAIGAAALHRSRRAAMRALPLIPDAGVDGRRHFRFAIPPGQHRVQLLPLLRRRIDNSGEPSAKCGHVHRTLPPSGKDLS